MTDRWIEEARKLIDVDCEVDAHERADGACVTCIASFGRAEYRKGIEDAARVLDEPTVYLPNGIGPAYSFKVNRQAAIRSLLPEGRDAAPAPEPPRTGDARDEVLREAKADIETTADALIESSCGCEGQRTVHSGDCAGLAAADTQLRLIAKIEAILAPTPPADEKCGECKGTGIDYMRVDGTEACWPCRGTGTKLEPPR